MDDADLRVRELERDIRAVADHADRFIRSIGVDVSEAAPSSVGSTAFRVAGDAYQRLALAKKKLDPAVWARTKVSHRSGDDLMAQLWVLQKELKKNATLSP